MTAAGTDGGRTGRRPGRSGAREAILTAATARFAEVGYDKASIRAIAGRAGVDPALVHHYFGTKQDLFLAVVDLPIDPSVVLDAIAAAPLERLGEGIIAALLAVWDSPAGDSVVAALRTVLGNAEPSLIRTFLLDIALKAVRERVDSPPGSGSTRVALVASQLVGVLVARKIIGLDPLASLSAADVVLLVGPTLQRYLTDNLPEVSGTNRY